MSDNDPWSRPTLKDLQEILENLQKPDTDNRRNIERLELSVPAEIRTARGNTVAAMTREISRSGIGILHRGSISLGEVTVKMAGDSQTFEYRVVIEWCTPCDNGMFMSGGRFLPKSTEATA
jgi:hypothetical protein